MARPLKAHEPGTQVTVSMRVPAELKTQLEEAAAAQDRNLSQECERRLRRSLDPELLGDDAIDAMLAAGGLHSQQCRDFLARALKLTCGHEAGEAGAFLAITLGIVRLIDRAAPGAEVKVRKAVLDDIKAAIRRLEREATITTEEK